MGHHVAIVVATGPDGRPAAHLVLRTLPGKHDLAGVPALVVTSPDDDEQHDAGEAATQLLEDGEYTYEFSAVDYNEPIGPWSTDHPEVFEPDTPGGERGRVRPRSYTGTLSVRVLLNGGTVGQLALEVRSRKLHYRKHYRWMLSDIAQLAVGLVGESFAASQQRLEATSAPDSASAYQRFALLRSLLVNPLLDASLTQVIARPHEDWVEERAHRDVRCGVSGAGIKVRDLVTGSTRVPWPTSYVAGLESLPTEVPTRQTATTVDTIPNRFVKFALGEWLGVVRSLGDAIATQPSSPSRTRGLCEVTETELLLHEAYDSPLFAQVGQLTVFPSGNQVLLKREGYREIFQAYLQAQMALTLSWSGGEAVFAAGQRNVATLYEFWCYLQVAEVLSELCDEWDGKSILVLRPDRMDLDLIGGKESVIRGKAKRLGRTIEVALHFNRSFSAKSSQPSWSVQMRPDCSVSLKGDDESAPTWVHFDAKYRVDELRQILGEPEPDADAGVAADTGGTSAKRDDLLKMHAYRDAIRRSAGAYVLYPGYEQTPTEPLREYHEIVPGLGAFALRPAGDGSAEGRAHVARFIGQVLTHRASVISQHRRGNFWEGQAYGGETPTVLSGALSGSDLPPADTAVLLGYVRDATHLAWIRDQLRYNMRTGNRRGAVGLNGRQLGAELVILYGPAQAVAEVRRTEGQPEVWGPDRMKASGYHLTPHTYLCLPLSKGALDTPPGLTSSQIGQLAREIGGKGWMLGAPVTVSWTNIVERLSG